LLPNLLAIVIVTKGYASGPHYNQRGSGSNFLCLPEDPQWKTYFNGHSTLSGGIAGVKYELFDSPHNNGK